MTVEEIKETVTMRDVLSRYGVKVGANGMCCCPIHNERHPSMKVFADGFKCFACGSGGDIFRFVQDMEGCDFKQAFIILGGTYAKHKNEKMQKLIKAKHERNKANREKLKDFERDFRQMLEDAMFKCRLVIEFHAPFSDAWCIAQRYLPWLEDMWDAKYLENEEIDKADVIRVCKRIKQIRHSV